MTEIEILMADWCTKDEAKEHLKNGTQIYDDFEENAEDYMEELECDEEQREQIRNIIQRKIPPEVIGWGRVIDKDENKTYYIQYFS